ncbi:MAG TPA: sigma-54 dependent transcriptional regulator, partial [Chitinophagales bacterium]|nr:sigma-54 dependent transcriptional regulator [Chitinophagales bacterium]
EILFIIKQALSQQQDTDMQAPRNARVKDSKSSKYLFSNSADAKYLQNQISLVAPTDYSVIIYGESGAGKEGVARLIHEKSRRSNMPFVAMDCGAISRELAGSELFGHEKGSFTGALNQKIGHFETAYGGTLFLDEVGNLPYDTQILLLRVLQERVLRRIGGNKEIPTDVRIIVASNERLSDACQRGKFREDLYHRLNEFGIELQPLRKRKEDIIYFANYFLTETSAELGKNIIGLEAEVEDVFLNYPWPGNVRELKNVIKRAVLLTHGDRVPVKALPFEILNHAQLQFNVAETDINGATNSNTQLNQMNPSFSAPEFSKPMLKKVAMEAEYEMIMTALAKTNFNKSKAAEILGIDRKTLYNKMKQMQMADK